MEYIGIFLIIFFAVLWILTERISFNKSKIITGQEKMIETYKKLHKSNETIIKLLKFESKLKNK